MLTTEATFGIMQSMESPRVLVVEDDETLRDVLTMALTDEGFEPIACGDGEEALRHCSQVLPQVVVLDVMLPGRSGIEVCALLRKLYDPSPGVVMVSARSSELDVILGLEVGADDYVLKPCRPREVAARVKALLRRLSRAKPEQPPVLKRGALELDETARRVSVHKQQLSMTPSEFSLLLYLARSPGRVFSRSQLLDQVFDSNLEAYARNVDSHIARIRKKLEVAGMDPVPIRTVHGVGYAFDEHGG